MEDPDTFDVLVGGVKKGEAMNKNPVVIGSDISCCAQLRVLDSTLPLTPGEKELIAQCMAVVSAKEGEDVSFGPMEILALGDMAQKYPTHTNEIIACSNHLSNSIEFDGDIPAEFYLQALGAHGTLADILSSAMKAGPISTYKDEDFEEDITDEEDNAQKATA